MNQNQKLGYMALGAGILAFGITIGQVITPDIKAQSNGVFDEITCRSLKVVDEKGKTAIRLNSELVGGNNSIVVNDTEGKTALSLNSDWDGNSIAVNDMEGKTVVRLHSDWVDGNSIVVNDTEGKTAVSLNSSDHNSVNVYYDGNGAISLFALGSHGRIFIRDRAGIPIWSAP